MEDTFKALGALVGVMLARTAVEPQYQCIKCNECYSYEEAKALTYLCEKGRCYGYLINTEHL